MGTESLPRNARPQNGIFRESLSFLVAGLNVDSQILDGDHLIVLYFFVRKQSPVQEPRLCEKDHSEIDWLDREGFLRDWKPSHPAYLGIKRAFEMLFL